MMQKNQNMTHVRIIIFTRFPLPGKAKTRLMPALGPEGAADLQRQMTEFSVKQASQTGFPLQIRFTGSDTVPMQKWLGKQYEYASQGEGDLGERMEKAFAEAFKKGAEKVLIVGCDCPDNRTANILDAVKLLDKTSCVLGPAADGGYYLIGLTKPHPELFKNINWGTGTVLRETILKAKEYKLLPILSDVDKPEDMPPKISVIIPALNEENNIASVVKQTMEGFLIEPIVVDGGSSDRTRETASRMGAKVMDSQAGRALQMNCGAKQAAGEILLFLHADSVLPPAWDCHVRKVMKRPGTSLGYFRFVINGSFVGRRWVEWSVNFRSRFFKRPYGDQGLFLRQTDFADMGGFPVVPILEDVLLVKRAKKTGDIRCTHTGLFTSGRRWIELGLFKTWFINKAVLLLARLGADLDSLNRAYCDGENPFYAIIKKAKKK